VRRRIALFASHLEIGIRACERDGLLAVLPDVLGRERKLRRLPFDDLPSVHLYAIHRPILGSEDRAAVVLDAVRAQLPAPASR